MNLLRSQNRISELMLRFREWVNHATAMDRTDPNKVAENLLIPILIEVYGYRNLKNLNYTKGKNYFAIDLGDETARVAFQITSTSGSEKIKKTLRKFVERELYEKYDKLIIYILTEKQPSYTGNGYQEIIQDKFTFDKDKDIWDYRDILREVSNFQSVDKARKVERILEDNFGEGRTLTEWEVVDNVERIVNEYTQLFVGREEESQKLDKFLSENPSGVMLVTAGAGFGKTALLANWVNAWRDKGCFIAYHFFTQRYGSVKSAYRNLLRQLYIYYKPTCEQISNDDEEHLKIGLYNLLREYGTPEGKPLVIVIDGLDEAEKTFSPPFPTPLPENVFVIASARAEKGEEHKYLEYWTDNSQTLPPLERLSCGAIANWLRQTGEGELAAFAEDTHFVAQLDEITQGFPLYLRYLTEELTHVAKQGQDVREVLAQTPKEFERYVEQELKRLDELDLPNERWQFFALLAVAKGALEKKEVKALTGMGDRQLRQLHLCWQVTRWMRITEGKLYAFAHPLLATTFAAQLGDDAEDALQDLIDYCAKWEKYQSRYALRHYAEHLREVERWEELYAIARKEDFAATQRQELPDEPELSLKTVQTALQGAADTDNAGAMTEFLLVHAKHCAEKTAQESPLDALHNESLKRALALADLHDVEICVLWYLLLAWVLKEQSRWKEAQETLEQLQRKNLSRLSDWQGDYAAYFLTYAFEVSEKAFLALYKQILDYRSHLALCKNLTERGYFTVALSAAQSIDIEWARIQALGEVTVALARAGDFPRALNTIDQLKEQKQRWLGKIAVAIAVAGDFDTALSTVQQVHDKVEQAKALAEIAKSIAIVAKLHSNTLFACFRAGEVGVLILLIATWYQEIAQLIFNTARETALSINNKRQQVRVLWEIAKSIAVAGNTKAAHSTLDIALEITQLIKYNQQHEREYELGEIAAVRAIAGDYPTALKMTEQINDERLNTLALVNIVKAIARAGNFPLALNTAQQIRDGVEQARALGKIVKAIARTGDFIAALKISQQICSDGEYTWTLVKVVQVMAEMAETGDFTDALKTTHRIYPDYHARAWTLGKIAMTMVATGKKEAALSTFETALETIRSIKNEQQWHIGQIAQAMAGKSVILGSELFANLEAKLTVIKEDFTPALEKAHQFEDGHKALVLTEIAEKMAMLGLGEQAVKTVMTILINRNWHLPRVASIFAQTGDKQNFKQLLIPCAHYLYAADQMCGFLVQLYPEQAMDVEKVVSEFR